jgi:hypothetical protein
VTLGFYFLRNMSSPAYNFAISMSASAALTALLSTGTAK